MSEIWVVVADASRARIFATERSSEPLRELESLSCPEGRLHDGDLVTDSPGRDRNAMSGSHDMGHAGSAREEAATRFAAQICDLLESARVEKRYFKLYILASPNFLGVLRKQRKNGVKELISDEIPKNVTTHTPEEIRKQLPEYL